VGLQGAGLTNLIWSNNKTKIIELRSKLTNKLYENLAIANKIDFKKLEFTPKDKVVADHYGSIEVDIKKLEKIL
jgi:capsular polysaccharide biosynthesis protein